VISCDIGGGQVMPRSSGGMDYKLYEKLEKKLLYWFEGCYIYDQVFSYRNLKRYFEFIENCKKDFLEKASSLGKGVVVTFSNDSLNFVFPDFHGDIELGNTGMLLVRFSVLLLMWKVFYLRDQSMLMYTSI